MDNHGIAISRSIIELYLDKYTITEFTYNNGNMENTTYEVSFYRNEQLTQELKGYITASINPLHPSLKQNVDRTANLKLFLDRVIWNREKINRIYGKLEICGKLICDSRDKQKQWARKTVLFRANTRC